jgi:hypothetical protein
LAEYQQTQDKFQQSLLESTMDSSIPPPPYNEQSTTSSAPNPNETNPSFSVTPAPGPGNKLLTMVPNTTLVGGTQHSESPVDSYKCRLACEMDADCVGAYSTLDMSDPSQPVETCTQVTGPPQQRTQVLPQPAPYTTAFVLPIVDYGTTLKTLHDKLVELLRDMTNLVTQHQQQQSMSMGRNKRGGGRNSKPLPPPAVVSARYRQWKDNQDIMASLQKRFQTLDAANRDSSLLVNRDYAWYWVWIGVIVVTVWLLLTTMAPVARYSLQPLLTKEYERMDAELAKDRQRMDAAFDDIKSPLVDKLDQVQHTARNQLDAVINKVSPIVAHVMSPPAANAAANAPRPPPPPPQQPNNNPPPPPQQRGGGTSSRHKRHRHRRHTSTRHSLFWYMGAPLVYVMLLLVWMYMLSA